MAHLPAVQASAAGNAVLVAGTTYYASVATADPGITGASEMTGVTRQPVVFSTWASGLTGNNAAIAIPNPGTTAATYVVIWSAVTAGTALYAIVLGSSVTAASITFAINAIAPLVSG